MFTVKVIKKYIGAPLTITLASRLTIVGLAGGMPGILPLPLLI
jgi:hypothetical protein